MPLTSTLPTSMETTRSYEDLSRDFAEVLVLLSMSTTSEPSPTQLSTVRHDRTRLETQWHRFLNHISWLCDYKTGGKTVTSVAAEEVAHGSRLWLASNAECQLKMKKHLESVLQEVGSFTKNPDSDFDDVHYRIFKNSVEFSHERVDFYSAKLYKLVRGSSDLRKDDPADQTLSQHLDELLYYCNDHEKLCVEAYRFRESHGWKLLWDRIKRSGNSSIWALVHHYIGRLGSWWKACTVLMTVAMDRPSFFKDIKVKSVKYHTMSINSLVIGEADLEGALDRLVHFCDANRSQQVRSSLELRWKDSSKVFSDRLRQRTAKPCVHAEVSMLEHFYRKGLSFAGCDRYIGCSKRSCYCCDLYMRLHPYEILRRPYHGNAWVKWCMPFKKETRITPNWVQRLDVMTEMIYQMRDEIFSRASSASISHVLESTTGITIDGRP